MTVKIIYGVHFIGARGVFIKLNNMVRALKVVSWFVLTYSIPKSIIFWFNFKKIQCIHDYVTLTSKITIIIRPNIIQFSAWVGKKIEEGCKSLEEEEVIYT